MITFNELQKMNAKELSEELAKVELDLAKTRLLITTRQSKETVKLKNLRRYRARIKTLQRMLVLPKEAKEAASAITS